MHILFFTDNFPPEVNAPASRTFEHCREWAAAGHQVTVVTGVPNFPKGKVFDGYRNRLWQEEEMSGIRVVRVWTYITANEGFVRRIIDYASFMVSGTIAAIAVKKVDIVVGTSPQLFTPCAAYLTSRMKRIPYVFELRDLWPESIRAVGAMKHAKMLNWLERLELFLYRNAKIIVSVTNAFCRNLASRGIDPGKISVVTNGVDTSRFKHQDKDAELVRTLGLDGKFVAGYIGTHGLAHALDTILDAAEKMQNMRGGDEFHFLLLGDGANKAKLVSDAKERGLKNIAFIDTVAKEEVVRYWSLLDVSIIHLKRSELFLSVIPSKLFECMGMGIPVLHGVAGESAEIVDEEKVGLTFVPEDADDLCEKLKWMKANPKSFASFRRNGIRSATKYDRRTLALNMLELLEKTGNSQAD